MNNESLQNDMINALFRDRKTERRWRNIRFFGWMFIILLLIFLIFAPKGSRTTSSTTGGSYVALLRLDGEIMPNASFSARRVVPLLNKVFADKAAKGVVLLINSPGGSAVQASIIHDKILQLKNKYHKKVVVVAEDALASGGYLVATAADKIYVNQDTLTGSIGVIMSGFGFSDAMQKVGVSRRVFTAGDNKDRMDPFLPLNPQDVAKVKTVLDDAHQEFIKDVLQGRSGKLRGDQKELFSGDFWTGNQAVQLGLVDGTGNLWDVMDQEFKVTKYKDYSSKPSAFDMIFKGVNSELNLGFANHTAGISALMSTN